MDGPLKIDQAFLQVFDYAPVGMFVIQKGRFVFGNKGFLTITGYTKPELAGVDPWDLVYGEDRPLVRSAAVDMLKGHRTVPYEYRTITKTGEIRWILETVVSVVFSGQRASLGYYMDVSDRKSAERALVESEKKYRTIFENTGTAMVITGEDATISLANAGMEQLSGYARSEIENRKLLSEFVLPEDRRRVCRHKRPMNAAAPYEFRFLGRSGRVRHVFAVQAPIPGTGQSVYSLVDITERKTIEEKLRVVSRHDNLTGLYNRACFEEKMARLEQYGPNLAGVIVLDLDGLKIINESFGHSTGDDMLVATAGILRSCFRREDIAARIGGDEFAVLLPGLDDAAVRRKCEQIREAVRTHNEENEKLALSISLGLAAGNPAETSLSELFLIADNNMCREKLFRNRSAKSALVRTMSKALEARDLVTEGHATRLQAVVTAMAGVLGLPDATVGNLRLLAEFHDIGKIGIPDCILCKPGPLTREEYHQMQKHCEIGHRISLSAPDLAHIADLVLMHHEWWNGQGYPFGLKREDIPLECRILAIADAYDAMTNDRPYRPAMPHEKALAEIRRGAGTQFDPRLVGEFFTNLPMFEDILLYDGEPRPSSA